MSPFVMCLNLSHLAKGNQAKQLYHMNHGERVHVSISGTRANIGQVKMSISVAPLLKRQSPSRSFGHGWIELPGGKRWNPAKPQMYSTGSIQKPFYKRFFG